MQIRSATAVTGALSAVLMLTGGCATSSATVSAGGPAAPASPASATPARVITLAPPKAKTVAPVLRNTGTAWPAILASLTAYGQWSLANPDPATIAAVAVPGCSTASQLGEQMSGLLGSQATVTPSPVVFGAFTSPSPVAAGVSEMVLYVSASRPAEPVMSRHGQQINTFPALPPTNLEITLNRGTDQRWRFCSIESIGDGAAEDPTVALL
ncbi:hypothetical protein ACWKSP_36460 [Micromonosporaceae bacterium Da 78-11]